MEAFYIGKNHPSDGLLTPEPCFLPMIQDHLSDILHPPQVDATHIIVGNDNNLPFSSSREPNKADDNELILLEVGEFLKAN